MNRSLKQPIYEKENQQKYVNKKTDILTSLHNIKLPLQHSLSYKQNQQFQSVPINNTLVGIKEQCNSARNVSTSINSFEHPLTDTQQYCQTYGRELENLLTKSKKPKRFLANHKIDGVLRARMLDWMVEVMSSYNFSHKTYFSGIQIMDRYFEDSHQILMPSQLHIIGVQSMFIATKMEQVYPLKTKTVYEKIAHKKIPISELVEMERKVCEVLDFDLTTSTFFDLACTKIALALTKAKSEYSTSKMKQMEAVCSCLGKFICYNYDMMCEFQKQTIANTLSNYILEIYKIPNVPKSQQKLVELECKELMIESIGTFKRKFKGLNNLAKFTDKNILEIIEKGLF